MSYNSDGTVNSVYGIAPDIYAQSEISDYFILKQLINDGEDAYSIDNRLKWDKVLIKAFELIEENT